MDLEQYESHMRDYRRAKACGDWARAHASLLQAIEACPVCEALGTLAALREEAARESKPVGAFRRLLGVRA